MYSEKIAIQSTIKENDTLYGNQGSEQDKKAVSAKTLF